MDVERLLHTAAPHLHLLVASPSSACDLMWSWQRTPKKRVVVRALRGQKMRTIEELFDECAAALQFPYYFGENWNALSDCLADLEWLDADAYIFVITAAPHLLEKEPAENARVFFELIENTAREWAKAKDHKPGRPAKPFHVVLQCAKEEAPEVKERLNTVGVSPSLLK